MSVFEIESVINTTKIFSDVLARGPMGPPGPANTSGVSLGLSTVDLAPFKTIIDLNSGPTNILVHTKPVDPQFTYTVIAGNVPASADIQDYMAIITIGGQNADVSDDTLSWCLTHNGVESSESDNGTSAGQYWYFAGAIAAVPISVGDVLGIKFWTGASVLVNFAYATIYIVPRALTTPKGFQTISNGSNYTQDAITGAVGGVTYIIGPSVTSIGFYDSILTLPATNTVAGSSYPSTFTPPLQAVQTVANQFAADITSISYNVEASPSLLYLAAGQFIRRLVNNIFIVGAPTFAGTPIYTPLIGTVNGTTGFDGNAVFTLPHAPLDPTQLMVVNKLQMVQGGLPLDYTYALVAGVGTITFNAGSIPVAGDHPYAQYDY
jgi:hypothetical protein